MDGSWKRDSLPELVEEESPENIEGKYEQEIKNPHKELEKCLTKGCLSF